MELISRIYFMSISYFYANDMDNHFFYDYEAGLWRTSQAQVKLTDQLPANRSSAALICSFTAANLFLICRRAIHYGIYGLTDVL